MFPDAIKHAVLLMFSGDKELLGIVLTSLQVSVMATLIATLVGVPLGYTLASTHFRGRRLVITIINTLQALPTVVIGLVFYGLLSRSGVFGGAHLLYTRTAIILGGGCLIFPLLSAYTMSSVLGVDQRIRKTARSLGAGVWREGWVMVHEARFGIAASVIAAFGRAIGEVGIAMMLGGNIAGFTRTMTTAIALEHNKGNFALSLALGFILLLIALIVNLVLQLFQGAGTK